ncbi:hypothetical protein KC675_01655 [Candidatus Dojkabacteria bacterium]|uniref:Uncharacterized protein n=1 Tax=Candidatus Dojkabacteria bacterium TaxID=2099670 RepID=A0A955L091_9BACT|nr:hypothetical protein [Candidatus Dojkabacteria bacterium]MCB0749450.1 hypothetical protein [Ignavibacteriota bacterium]
MQELNAFNLLPDNLMPVVSLQPNAYEELKRRISKIPTALGINYGAFQQEFVELFWEPPASGFDSRTVDVLYYSLMLAYDRIAGLTIHPQVAKFLPSYFSFDVSSIHEAAQREEEKTHILLGSLTPYSTLAHEKAVEFLFGSSANAIHFDIGSVQLTSPVLKSSPSFQADARQLPLSPNSVITFWSNNLFGEFGRSIKEKIAVFSELDRTLSTGGAFLGVETTENTNLAIDFFKSHAYETSVKPALCYTSASQEEDFLLRGKSNFKVETNYDGYFSFMVTKLN